MFVCVCVCVNTYICISIIVQGMKTIRREEKKRNKSYNEIDAYACMVKRNLEEFNAW
jgi:hypothetical protein